MSRSQTAALLQQLGPWAAQRRDNACSDRELLRRFAVQRDEAAFAAVVRRHGPMVLSVCRRILHQAQDAEDAFQATFLVLFRKAGSHLWRDSVGGWLHRVAAHIALRLRVSQTKLSSSRCAEEGIIADPLEQLTVREMLAAFDEELAQLPERFREPLVLCYLEGKTQEEAARQLGRSLSTVRRCLETARKLLHQRLTRRGLELPAVLGTVLLSREASAAVSAPLCAALAQALQGGGPGRVNALAQGALHALGMARLKTEVALVAVLSMVAAGAGWTAWGVLRGGGAMLAPPEPLSPALHAERSPERPREDDKPALRLDRHGDLLPPGAVMRLGTLRFRLDAEIEGGLAFAPDGKTLAVCGNGLWLLDAVSGKPLRRLDHSQAPNPRIAFSPDGKRLIYTGLASQRDPIRPIIHYRPVVRVWETTSGRQVIETELAAVCWVGWSVDRQPLAAYVAEGEVRLRDLATGRQRRFPAKNLPDPNVAELCTCIVGKKVLAASDEKSRVHVWGLAGGQERYCLDAGGRYVRSLSFSPDERRLVSLAQGAAGASFVRVWDVGTGTLRQTLAGDQKLLSELAFAPDGKTLATVGWTEVRLWDVATGSQRCRFASPSGWFGQSVVFSPDSKTLAVSERYSGAIHLWDTASGKQKAVPEGHTNGPRKAVFSPDGKRVATGGRMHGALLVWDPATGEALVRIHRDGDVHGYAFSADGRTLYSLWNDQLCFDDAATGRPLHVVKVEDPDRPTASLSGESLHVSDDHTRIIVCCSSKQRDGAGLLVTCWDAATRKLLFHRRRNRTTHGNAVSSDGQLLATAEGAKGDRRGEVMGAGPTRVEDLASGEPLLTFRPFAGQRLPVAFSPDGRLLISSSHGQTTEDSSDTWRLAEVLTGREILSWPAPDPNARAAFSPNGKLLAVNASFGEILLWNLAKGKAQLRLKGFNAKVTSLAFSPDSRRLVSGLSDSTLLVWEVPAGEDAQVKLAAKDVLRAWNDLAAADVPRAFRARWTLASAPEQAMLLLTKHLHRTHPADAQNLCRLLADLESDQYRIREQAQIELAELGDLAEPALRKALEDKPSLEVRRRVQGLLERLRGPVTKPELLRSLRAVAVLEDIGTPEARRELEKLAQGAPEARLTREAKASLRRLALRAPSGLGSATPGKVPPARRCPQVFCLPAAHGKFPA